MPAVSVCPEAALLEQFLLGAVTDPDADRIEAHLMGCTKCTTTIQKLRAEDGVVEALRQAVKQQAVGHDDLMHAMAPLLKRLRPPKSTETLPCEDQVSSGTVDTVQPAAALFDKDAHGHGEQLGPYRLLEVLGSGGMGKVYRAYDPRLKRELALKVIRPDLAAHPGIVQRFLREAQAAAAIEHENIITVYQASEADGVPFLAMPLLRGETLDKRLARAGGRLPIDEVLHVGRETALGLGAAHRRGLIHRDIKPSNIFLEVREGVEQKERTGAGERGRRGAADSFTDTSVGETATKEMTLGTPTPLLPSSLSRSSHPAPLLPRPSYRVKILDFGVARAIRGGSTGGTQAGLILGTPAYMAPEQARGEAVDGRSDLFSLGCVLYHLTTGKLPFKGSDPLSVLLEAATTQPPAPRTIDASIPKALEDVIVGLMKKRPADRPASAQRVVEVLERIEKARRPVEHPQMTRRGWLIAAGMGLVGGGALGGLGLWGWLGRSNNGNGSSSTVGTPLPIDEETGTVELVYDEADPRLILTSGKTETKVDPRETKKLMLAPGYYQVRPVLEIKDRTLVPDRFIVKSGETQTVTLALVGEIARHVEHKHNGSVSGVAVASRKGELVVVSGGLGDRSVYVWNPRGKDEARRLEHGNPVHCVAITADGKRAASAGGEKGASPDLAIHLWNLDVIAADGEPLEGHRSLVTALAFSPDGTRLLSGARDGAALLWDLDKRRSAPLNGHDGLGVHAVAIAADGKQGLTAGGDGQVILWDLERKEVIRRLEKAHTGAVRSVTFLGGSAGFASAGDDGVIRIWDAKSFEARSLTIAESKIRCAAAAPDGSRLLIGTDVGSLTLWNVSDGKQIIALAGHGKSAVHGVAFTPDGFRAVSGGKDGTVRYWQLPR